MVMIPFPPFEPDKSLYNPAAAANVVNALPVADGWGPMPTFTTVSAALPSACLGAVFVKDSASVVTVIAGTSTNLYKLNTGTNPYSWDEVSKSTDAYSVPDGDKWQFTVFGDYLVACNLGGTPQYYSISGGGSFADLTGAPTARYVWNAGDFLVFGYLDGAPNTVRWSGLNDATFWTAGERGSDIQVLPTGREIMGAIGDERGALIIHAEAMRYMQFAPASGYTFTFAEANTRRGAVAAHSIVQIGPEQFVYLSEDGFFAGVEGRPIGAERIDRWFQDQIDLDLLYDVRGMADPYQKMVWWRFKNVDGENVLLGYDWQLDRWTYSTQQITEAAAIATSGLAWDALASLYDSIDDVTEPFDSRLFKGGRPTFAGFTTDNKLAFATGQNAAAVIETAQMELNGGARAFVNSARVITGTTDYTAQVGVAGYHGDDITWGDAVSPSARSKRMAFRADGRLHKFRVNFAAGADWKSAVGIDVNATGAGVL